MSLATSLLLESLSRRAHGFPSRIISQVTPDVKYQFVFAPFLKVQPPSYGVQRLPGAGLWYNTAMMPGNSTANNHSLAPLSLDADAWDRFVERVPNGHVLQSAGWGRFKGAHGWQAHSVAVGADGQPGAGALLLSRRLPLLGSIGYIPRGPLGDWYGPGVSGPLFAALHDEARRLGVFLLKIEPELPDRAPQLGVLLRASFRPSEQTVQPRSTVWIDLAGSEEDIRARMKAKTRYNIGLAARKGVSVRAGEAADLPAFSALMQQTGARDGFAVHAPSYYADAFATFVPSGAGRLFLAEFEGRLLAGLMAFACAGKAWYMYGASSDAERNRMPTYALQWSAMCWARARGCLRYDLWGIPDEVGQRPEDYQETVTDRHDGLWGVYRFKQGFGGEVLRYAGAYDCIYSPLRARLYALALRLRRAGALAG
jgi:peptidoglycan pentaglycine glycine transferase (the first glycine)